jgi:hypothetical protein
MHTLKELRASRFVNADSTELIAMDFSSRDEVEEKPEENDSIFDVS